MGAVARQVLMRPPVALLVIAFSTLVRSLNASTSARLRRMPSGVLIAATATIIVCLALVILAETTPSTANIEALEPLAQRLSPRVLAEPVLPEAAIKNFRLGSHAYIGCSLSAAVLLAFRPEPPELVALAAVERCAEQASKLRELAIPIAGNGGSLHIMLEVDDLLREQARTIVIAIREEAEQQSRGAF